MQLIFLCFSFFYVLVGLTFFYENSKESLYKKESCREETIFFEKSDDCLLPRIDSHAPKEHLAIRIATERYNKGNDP